MGEQTQSLFRRAVSRIGDEALAAFALVAATLAALIWANIGNSYEGFWNTHAAITVGGGSLDLTVGQWVNEGLMTLFFFGIGLDVRREFALGQLRRPAAALLPVAAAIGGLVVPALVFLLIDHSGPEAHAWGAVISTDTAFAVGILALVGPKNTSHLRVFVLAFAVVDDIGALTVIAVFYTDDLQPLWLLPVAAGLAVAWWMARRGVWHTIGYLLISGFVWFCTLQSGVHATLAGVLLALLMPVHATQLGDVDTAAHAPSPHPSCGVWLPALCWASSSASARSARSCSGSSRKAADAAWIRHGRSVWALSRGSGSRSRCS